MQLLFHQLCSLFTKQSCLVESLLQFQPTCHKVARQSVPHFPPSATGEPPEEEGGHGGHDGAKFFCHLMAMLSYSCRAYNGSRSCTLYRMVGENGWNLVVGFPTATGSITTIVPNDVHHTSSSPLIQKYDAQKLII